MVFSVYVCDGCKKRIDLDNSLEYSDQTRGWHKRIDLDNSLEYSDQTRGWHNVRFRPFNGRNELPAIDLCPDCVKTAKEAINL